MRCPKWQELYAADPGRALDPVAEHARWAAEDKQADKDKGRQRVVAANTERRVAQAGRFARLKDPDLGD